MKRNRLLHIDCVEVDPNYLQAFQFFLGIIWQDASVEDIRSSKDGMYSIDLAMSGTVKGELIMLMFEDWKSKLMHEMYSIRN